MNETLISYNPFTLHGKTVLITGASSGIGRCMAIQVSMAGAQVILTGRNIQKLQETYQELRPDQNRYVVADLNNEDEIVQLVKNMPLLDGVVHSAGVIKRLPLKSITKNSLQDLMQINFFAPAILTQQLHKNKLLKKDASVVFISSVAASFASLGNIMYMASKGAINSFMKGIALELAVSGIRANAIQPGMIKTNLTSAIPDEDIEKDVLRYPLQRYGKPEEVAYATIFLLSDATKWMTGSLLTLDGGLTLR